MTVALVLRKKDGSSKTIQVPNRASILGRRQDCDLCIPLQVISRRHCQISQENDDVKIRDLKSSNGTFLNGQKIDDESPIKAGDKLQLGPVKFTIQIDGQPDMANIPSSENTNPGNVYEDPDNQMMNGSGTFLSKSSV